MTTGYTGTNSETLTELERAVVEAAIRLRQGALAIALRVKTATIEEGVVDDELLGDDYYVLLSTESKARRELTSATDALLAARAESSPPVNQ